MSGNYTGVGTNYLTYSPGDFAGNGAFSMVLLCRPDNFNARLMSWFNGASEEKSLLLDTGHIYSTNDFSSGYGSGIGSTPAQWYIVAVTKPSGSAHYRMHYWLYDAGGANTFNHGESVGAANQANGAAATACRVGWALAGMTGDIAVAGYWDRALSDADLDTLKTNQLLAWYNLAPDLGIHLGSWNGTSGDVVFSGSSGTATKTGTVSSAVNPTSFNFSIFPPIPNLGNEIGWTSTHIRSQFADHDFRSILTDKGWFDRELEVLGWFDDALIPIASSGPPPVVYNGWGIAI